ncbi:MAG: aspartate aminotransferase [Syntrophaceae bacterium CG2_30_49_12]|nr:MAG: aspartate aminotransferase [Syntrophaceae bacterium CG2_30_49_12]PIP06406.1 MAG: aspartate aminotransferase [Syntrophobacterales bacterium CG23_combo_of_CG06-09_8_20_14_all_48_27]PJA50446.1 MAG: aspartate aminotransferase [Syntrophobacterales bacterium CG_4_9_14_3_um_filter_49_8]PJC73365.1 MAG: aspartate aminotransferase [Syntrophobacterales bacterium CG_4_8_14_3_um_filter_49_14]
MTISKKIQGFLSGSSWIRKMFEEGLSLKLQYGAGNVFDFSLGNPSLEPPARFKELLRDVAGENISGMHGYMPNAGYAETREAVAFYLSGEHSVPLSAEHIIMTCGAGGALNVILKTLLDPGDEVIIPTPFFVEYRFYVDNNGGITKLVKTKEDFSLDLGAMGDAFTEKTKIVLINSPNNPTGKVYNEATIRKLTAIIEEKCRVYGKDIYLVSDEPYSDIVYDGVKVPSILSACKNSIIASSYSKSLSLAGERIGFIAVNPENANLEDVINGMVLSNRILGFVNAPALMQRIVARIQGERVNVEEYRKKRDMLCDGLSSFGYQFTRPEGTFYLFVRTPIEDDVEFVRALQKRKILTVPGSGFGGPGHFRIAYCVDDATIINAMEGFGQTLKEYLP